MYVIIIIIIIIMFLKCKACFLFLDPQDEVGPSISSSVVLCSFVSFLTFQFLLTLASGSKLLCQIVRRVCGDDARGT